MASIINASSTGSGGIVQTADASGVLQLQSNGTVALSISGAATTFGGNMLLEASGNPTMTVKTTGAGNNPLYRLQADTNYWEMMGVFSDSNDTLRFRYNGTDRMVMNNSGVLALSGGDSDANGVGITFPATQSASSNANTLDDYEEGTFTVGVRGASTAGTYTISSQTCSYTKIGRLVSLTIWVTGFSVASGGTAYMQVTGLPFTNSITSKGSASVRFFDFSASTLFVVPSFIGSSGVSILYFEEVKDAANATDFDIAGISTSSNFQLTITYSTS